MGGGGELNMRFRLLFTLARCEAFIGGDLGAYTGSYCSWLAAMDLTEGSSCY